MSTLTPASEVVLRHADSFTTRHILFAGDLQDNLPSQIDAAEVRVHTQMYHHWQLLRTSLQDRCYFSLAPTAEQLAGIDTLIYYWPKSKREAQFHLHSLCALLPVGCDIFIVGENRSGVRSAETLSQSFVTLNKIDSARRCGLYHGELEKQPDFDLASWWHSYQTGSLTISTLPGVFSNDGLDVGSHLLLSSLNPGLTGKVLDMGCGAGVLSAALARMSPKVTLTLTDVHAAALASSKKTLAENNIEGEVITSNVFSDIDGRYDLIISNPPFHEGRQTSLLAAQSLIRGAAKHLHIGGELRLVANAFLPYPQLLDEVFGSHQVVAQTGRFKVYSALLNRTAVSKAKR